MLLGVKPLTFLARLIAFFAATFVVWHLIAPYYTHLLRLLIQGAVSASEIFGDSTTRLATTVVVRDTANGQGIFFFHRLFPQQAWPGVPADWVQANMVLLIPLMLATPAPSLSVRLKRLGIALAVAALLQVLGVVVVIKSTWVSVLGPAHYGVVQRKLYHFLDAFTQAFDTQLFPVAIWAGVHFRQLLAMGQRITATPVAAAEPAPVRPVPRSKRRRERRAQESRGGR